MYMYVVCRFDAYEGYNFDYLSKCFLTKEAAEKYCEKINSGEGNNNYDVIEIEKGIE